MPTHQDTRITLLRSSQQKLLRWVRQATGFVGSDTQERCAEGIKWCTKEAIASYEDADRAWDNAKWQYEQRKAVEHLLRGILGDPDGYVPKAEAYLKLSSWKSKGELERERKAAELKTAP